jgi:protein-S-isoprenylcysteine O-methyltransferase Ste14
VSPSDLQLISTVAITTCYSVVAAVWVLGAIYNFFRGPDEQDHMWFSWPSVLLFGIGTAIVNRVPVETWKPLVVHASWIRLTGLGLLAGSTVITLWARLVLGSMWTGDPVIKVGHRLRESGPYAVVRHPIYTGVLGMMIGAVLLSGGGRWIVFLGMNLVYVEVKIFFEERVLIDAFGDEYRRYRSRVPRLIPGRTLLAGHSIGRGKGSPVNSAPTGLT